MKKTFYERPIIGGPISNIMLDDNESKCKTLNTIKNGVIIGVVVVGVVATIVTCPIEGAAVATVVVA